MNVQIKFGSHVQKRIKERCGMSVSDILEYYKNGKTILLGRDKHDKNVIHHFFWSPLDEDYFVMLINERDKKVITLFPRNQSRFMISNESCILARRAALGETEVAEGTESTGPKPPDFKFVFYTPGNNCYRPKYHIEQKRYSGNLDKFSQDFEQVRKFVRHLRKVGFTPENIISMYATCGKEERKVRDDLLREAIKQS